MTDHSTDPTGPLTIGSIPGADLDQYDRGLRHPPAARRRGARPRGLHRPQQVTADFDHRVIPMAALFDL